ncbi:MAG: leucine-rich repeat protein [Acinetobacter sp.]
MATYTGTADANGDFNISFGGASYASAQKVTVTATKSGSSKSVELYAPADLTGGGAIQFSGNLNNFPDNIGVITLSSDFTGSIRDYAMQAIGNPTSMFNKATGLIMNSGVTSIGVLSFSGWTLGTILVLPTTLLTVGNQAFSTWSALLEILIPNSVTSLGNGAFQTATACKKLTLGTSLATIGASAFVSLTACDEIICLRTAPPVIQSNTFNSLKTTCVIKVPSASLAAYQTAPNWSVHASKMVGV